TRGLRVGRIGGGDGTRTRGLLRDRRSNQLNYAPHGTTHSPYYCALRCRLAPQPRGAHKSGLRADWNHRENLAKCFEMWWPGTELSRRQPFQTYKNLTGLRWLRKSFKIRERRSILGLRSWAEIGASNDRLPAD